MLFEADNISKAFGGNVVLRDVGFHIDEGEVVGLIGPNGAGKTTLFNVISGFLRSKTGSLTFDGRDISRLTPERICSSGLARTFQITKPFGGITVAENVMIGAFSQTSSLAGARAKALEILDFVGLYDKREALGRSLTIADRKRLEIARALATSPRMLLLDEVMAGLNPQELQEVIELVRAVRETGVTLFVIEHIMGVIMTISDRVIVLDYGRMLCQGPPESVSCDPEVIKAYLGEEYIAAQN